MPRRLDAAREHGAYDIAMTLPQDPPVTAASLIAMNLFLGPFVLLPWICLGVAPERPAWLVLMMAALSGIVFAILLSMWRRWLVLNNGLLHRELFAVIDRDALEIERKNHYLTLWNRETPPKRVPYVGGEPHINIGDVGVAVFRGDLLVNMIKIPIEWKPR